MAMHEMAAMQGMLRTVLTCMRQAGAIQVTHVQLALSVSGHMTAEAAHQLFAMLVRGTPIEGASLAIWWLPASYQCLTCRHRFESGAPCEQVLCPQCGEVALEVEHQEICTVRSIDVSCSSVQKNCSPQPGQKPPTSLRARQRPDARGQKEEEAQ
jgi:Zn finger protein HypA/HybF involved in hydrogenase expression